MASARQQCIDAVLGGMKLHYAAIKYGLQLGPNSRSPEYRKLAKHIKNIKNEKRIRAGLYFLLHISCPFYLLVCAVDSFLNVRCFV